MSAKIEFLTGKGGLPTISIDTATSEALIYLHGGHVANFRKKSESKPILWMSAQSKFDPASAVRGGIPVIFPWFGGREGKSAHGFARVTGWTLKQVETLAGDKVQLLLELNATPQAAEFPPFKAEYLITVSDVLELELRISNLSGDQPFSFEQCLHTYFTVGDIAPVKIFGLKGVHYLDKVAGGVEKTEANDFISITSEVDRVYQDTFSAVEIRDSSLNRTIVVEKQGSLSTVVWNPWIAKAKAMADFGDEEYHGMVCVESGSVGKNKIDLLPGKSSVMKVRISSKAGA